MANRRARDADEAARRRSRAVVWAFLALVAIAAVISFVAVGAGKHPPYEGPRECVRVDVDGPLVCTPS